MKKGFTLVELIAVLAILSILSTLVLANIIQRANDMKVISEEKLEESIISSAKHYVEKRPSLKSRIRSGETTKIEYNTLKSEGYLPNEIIDLTTYRKENMSYWAVCVKYEEGKFEYNVVPKTECTQD